MNKADHLAEVKRIHAEVERVCTGCEFQDGKYCNWWQKNTDGPPSCQEHRPDEKLTATYFNFSPMTGISDDEILDPFFSNFACHTCGSVLAGNRHYASATIGKAHSGPREKLEICVDCFEYFFT